MSLSDSKTNQDKTFEVLKMLNSCVEILDGENVLHSDRSYIKKRSLN